MNDEQPEPVKKYRKVRSTPDLSKKLGVPVYKSWDKVPYGLKTEMQMKNEGLKIGKPVGAKLSEFEKEGYLFLYRKEG